MTNKTTTTMASDDATKGLRPENSRLNALLRLNIKKLGSGAADGHADANLAA
jgi:hypothetical protein